MRGKADARGSCGMDYRIRCHAMPAELSAILSGGRIPRGDELGQLLDAVAAAYERAYAAVRSVVVFGGITLGEFHPRFSDIDLAVVFDTEAPLPPNHLPEAVRASVDGLPLFAETCVNPKHVKTSTLEAMAPRDWRDWVAHARNGLVTDTAYPFTLCDTWLLHHRGLTVRGADLLGDFPFRGAPPTAPSLELSRVMWYADRFARAKPFGGLAGVELVGEIIYYATTFTRGIYTLRTGRVTGRVASTRWYGRRFGGGAGEYARSLGRRRSCPDPSALQPPEDPVADLLPLFIHYVREVLDYVARERMA